MSLDFDALVLAPAHASFGEVNRGFPIPVYAPVSGASFTIDGVFRLPTIDVLGDGEAPPVSTRQPELDFRLSQFPVGVVPAQGDAVTVRGVAYVIKDTRPDGDGLVTLSLTEAP